MSNSNRDFNFRESVICSFRGKSFLRANFFYKLVCLLFGDSDTFFPILALLVNYFAFMNSLCLFLYRQTLVYIETPLFI